MTPRRATTSSAGLIELEWAIWAAGGFGAAAGAGAALALTFATFRGVPLVVVVGQSANVGYGGGLGGLFFGDSTSLSSAIGIAGGGGGQGSADIGVFAGGAGGVPGADGTSHAANPSGYGRGASTSAGGAGGTSGFQSGTAGAALQGGKGAGVGAPANLYGGGGSNVGSGGNWYGGGGGGGKYGGGGSSYYGDSQGGWGGGGGSSLIPSIGALTISHLAIWVSSATGFNGSGTTPGNTASPLRGTKGSPSNHGRLVVRERQVGLSSWSEWLTYDFTGSDQHHVVGSTL